MGAEDQSNVLGVFMFLLNGLSSITIIMVNKQLMSKGGYGFNFGAYAPWVDPPSVLYLPERLDSGG